MSNKFDLSKELIGRRALVTGANATQLLVSNRGKFLTGVNYRVDGGMTVR